MNEQQALARMVPPGAKRAGKWRMGVIQVWVTRACDNSCFGCTQGSNLGGRPGFITPDQFETALLSLKDYFGVVGTFGGNPALHPRFEELCALVRRHVPFPQRGLWCNNPVTVERARVMRETFNPAHSNLNVHLSKKAYDMFKEGWPECRPVGLDRDSRHSPVHLAMRDLDSLPTPKSSRGEGTGFAERVPNTEEARYDLISQCDINQHWSAMVGVFRGGVRAWFCEVAGAQAMLHQDDPEYPDTGMPVVSAAGRPIASWWRLSMSAFAGQVRKHCHECGVPLRGAGELAMTDDPGAVEYTSRTHLPVFGPKRKGRGVVVATDLLELGTGRVHNVVSYLENGANKK